MEFFTKDYIDFISKCKTEREVIDYAVLQLGPKACQSTRKMLYRTLRNKALFAVYIGCPSYAGINLIATHADCPRLDFKQNPFIEQIGIVQAKTHYYGGIRKHQWFARPLAIHGIIILEDGNPLKICIGEDQSDPVFCIEDLLPHLAKKQREEKLSNAFEGEKLNLILGLDSKKVIFDLLYNKYGVKENDFITAEIEVVPAGPARYVGFDESMIGGYGQDDRSNLFCALSAFLDTNESTNTALMIWDKEEIGSYGATGAQSKFLEYCMENVAAEIDISLSDVMLCTRAISADALPALDPDYQDAHDKCNAAWLGKGPSFAKFSGSRGKVGANDADAEFYAQIVRTLNEDKIKWQSAEIGKVDFGGGGTVALHLAHLGMNVIDFGCPVLSMHSPFELTSCFDLYETYKAFKSFYKMV